jgi:hypothetical protein
MQVVPLVATNTINEKPSRKVIVAQREWRSMAVPRHRCRRVQLLHANVNYRGPEFRTGRSGLQSGVRRGYVWGKTAVTELAMDDKTRIELEAAAFRRLIEHLRKRTDVQNIDMMNLAGFCRNCLSNWMKEAADAKGVPMSKDESREAIYGMPAEEWKAKYQKDASPEQLAAFEKASRQH